MVVGTGADGVLDISGVGGAADNGVSGSDVGSGFMSKDVLADKKVELKGRSDVDPPMV